VADLVKMNGTFFFAGYDTEYGGELWMSDGTTEGPRIVKDIYPGSRLGPPHLATNTLTAWPAYAQTGMVVSLAITWPLRPRIR
jgi:ELWxxDGT repeat protein